MVVLGYALHRHASPSVLDVGCGEGVLLSMLQRFPLAEYHGMDVSREAIHCARSRLLSEPGASAVSCIRFTIADFEDFAPPRAYDVIVFNDSLMYANDPLRVLERFADHLAPGGFVVASLCYNRWQVPIWKRIGRKFRTVHSADVTNEGGLVWHVRVLARRTESHGISAPSDSTGSKANGAGGFDSKLCAPPTLTGY